MTVTTATFLEALNQARAGAPTDTVFAIESTGGELVHDVNLGWVSIPGPDDH